MHDVGGKLLSRIKNIYVNNSAIVKVKRGESERFRIDSVVRQGCMSPWLFNVNICEGGVHGDGKEGSELPGGWERV